LSSNEEEGEEVEEGRRGEMWSSRWLEEGNMVKMMKMVDRKGGGKKLYNNKM
jgi:hypothetical protein